MDESVKSSKEKAEESPQLPPLPGPLSDQSSLFPGFIAAIARQIMANSSIIILNITREFLQFWFRFPVKMFRPFAVNPYLVFNEMAGNQAASWKFIWKTSRKEGFRMLGLNVLPLLLANSLVGAVLFNTYTLSNHLLKSAKSNFYDSFASGAVAGATQSLLSNPLYRIQKSLEKDSHAVNRHKGVLSLYGNAYRNLPVKGWSRFTYLYKGVFYNLLRDCVGFSLFFGVFENTNYFGKKALAMYFKAPFYQRESRAEHFKHLKERPASLAFAQGLSTVVSGGMAGMAYQSFVYPLDTFHFQVKQLQKHYTQTNQFILAYRNLKKESIRSLFQGMGSTLLKAVPASAIGLFAYEVTSDYIAHF
jgi:hypothetical protein